MKIIILSPNTNTLFSKEHLAVLKSLGELKIVSEIKPLYEVNELFKSGEKIVAIDPDFCNWKVPNEVLDKVPDLKAVCLQTTSFSWIDVDYLAEKNIPVTNLRGFSTIAVAEWATMMVMTLARKVPVMMQDNWKQSYDDHRGIELRRKTAGIIGLGRIGTAIAENMQGLGMNIQYWSKNSSDKRFTKVSLEKLIQTSDVILPVVAQNSETKGLITDKMLKSMKKSAIFVSVVHEVYNHELLLKLAEKGKIFGYGFETTNGKPDKYKGNVWSGPELAWCTEDSFRKNGEQWVESIVNASKGKYHTKVN